MKTLLFTAALLMGVAARPVLAQLVWHEGEATLNTGITIRGELSFQPDANALLIRVAGKCRVYPAGQLQGFQYVDKTSARYHFFKAYTVVKNGQEEETALLFEELVPGATVRLLQLPGNRAERVGGQYDLPAVRKPDRQTLQPRYVWIDGRFVAPDVFVETELSDLLANSPEAVQRWFNGRPRPVGPKALARWLACYHGQMELAKKIANPTIITWQK